jgi:hypothetical protein
MKKSFLILFAILSTIVTRSQDMDNPGQYMSAISKAHTEMNQRYMEYVSAAAHGRRARKVEKLRKAVLDNIDKAQDYTLNLSYYKGDNSLRQSSIDYIKMCYNIFNDDYAKIVNLEEIAEQSFDGMEAYLLLQEKTNQKLNEAYEKMRAATKAFAAKYNVNLVESTSELNEKMGVANELTHYHNQIFLVFFKSNWQETNLTKAVNDKKLNDAEQSRNALIKYAKEGIAVLDTTKGFEGDKALVSACKEVLKFYLNEAQNDAPKVTEYFVKQENFEKIKKGMEGKSSPTKEEVDSYNKAVNDINLAVNSFNQLNSSMNTGRQEALKNWESTSKEFMDTHMPHYKR